MVYCEAHPAAEPAKKLFKYTMTTHVGFAVPNCKSKQDDRGAEKIKWVEPTDKRLFHDKWWDMNQNNKTIMQSKTSRLELCRNLPCADMADAHDKFYQNNIWYKTFSKHHNIGSKVHIFCPAEFWRTEEPAPLAPAVPSKAAEPAASAPGPKAATAASAASAAAAPAQADQSPAWSTDYQVPAEGPAFKPVPPGTPISLGSFLPRPGPAFKSPPSRGTQLPEAPPEEEVPATSFADAPDSTSTSSAAQQGQPDYYTPPRAKNPPWVSAKAAAAPAVPAVPAAAPAVPAKPRPAAPAVRSTASSSGTAPQAAEPADFLQSTLGRQRVQFSPDVQFTRSLQPSRDDSMGWLRQHSLESYSVGLEFLNQCQGLSEEMQTRCKDLMQQRRPIWLNQRFGSELLADILGQAAESSKIEVLNVRSGFYDPDRDATRKYHTGYHPQNLELFCEQKGFNPWLEDALKRIFCQSEATRLAAAEPGQATAPGAIHCLLWCNKGTHRSVSACRVLSFVAGELRMNS